MANRKPHNFTTEQRQKGLEAARLARMEKAKQRREAKAQAEHQPVQTVEELEDRARETMQPEPAKGNTLELAKTFSQFLIMGTILAAFGLQQPAVAMTDAEAGAVAIPLAHIFARTPLNRQIGQYLIGSNDYVALVWGLFQYGQRVMGNWIHEQKIQPIRNYAETGNARVQGNAPESVLSPKSASNGKQPSPAISVTPRLYGGAWRSD